MSEPAHAPPPRGCLVSLWVGFALTVYACGDLTGAWISVSPSEAEAELTAVLGFDVPPVQRVADADDLGWAPTDGPHYGYTAVFDEAGFARFRSHLPEGTPVEWELVDEAESITHLFQLDTTANSVQYFHADE